MMEQLQTNPTFKTTTTGLLLSRTEILMLEHYREVTGHYMAEAIRQEINQLVIPENPSKLHHFNVVISQKQSQYLTKYSQKLGITKAKVIREMIHRIYWRLVYQGAEHSVRKPAN